MPGTDRRLVGPRVRRNAQPVGLGVKRLWLRPKAAPRWALGRSGVTDSRGMCQRRVSCYGARQRTQANRLGPRSVERTAKPGGCACRARDGDTPRFSDLPIGGHCPAFQTVFDADNSECKRINRERPESAREQEKCACWSHTLVLATDLVLQTPFSLPFRAFRGSPLFSLSYTAPGQE